MKREIKIEPISLEEARRLLNLRDLSNPAEGRHALQMINERVIKSLENLWQTKSMIYRESPIVSIEDNYDKIGYPEDGASRESRYTRYVCNTALLRTMTSAMVPRAIQKVKTDGDIDILLVARGFAIAEIALTKFTLVSRTKWIIGI